jgi:hypothetical protein
MFSPYSRRTVSDKNDRPDVPARVAVATCFVTRSQPMVVRAATTSMRRVPILVCIDPSLPTRRHLFRRGDIPNPPYLEDVATLSSNESDAGFQERTPRSSFNSTMRGRIVLPAAVSSKAIATVS